MAQYYFNGFRVTQLSLSQGFRPGRPEHYGQLASQLHSGEGLGPGEVFRVADLARLAPRTDGAASPGVQAALAHHERSHRQREDHLLDQF